MLPWTLLFPASSLCGASSPRPGSGSVLRRGDEDVRQLQCEDALGVEQVSRNVEGVRGGGFQTREGGDARNLGEVRDGKNRHGLDPGLGGVDGHLLTLLHGGDQLLTELLGNVGHLGLAGGLRCYHGELLKRLERCTATPTQLKHIYRVLGMSSTRYPESLPVVLRPVGVATCPGRR